MKWNRKCYFIGPFPLLLVFFFNFSSENFLIIAVYPEMNIGIVGRCGFEEILDSITK